ncbi:hypothetical protein [Rhizobium tumorigenes]|uniref:Uncharacterized protein n=1 Tax=Rhizobium tumorigenes TaxID=2041385 RepID=A0AAF1KRR5_9HYPH|nr:hypothetical protein [Rhizobium tumorigenes]WFR96488.1 hypothetical protein PR017_04995 [Rhizobium tumorigenes]
MMMTAVANVTDNRLQMSMKPVLADMVLGNSEADKLVESIRGRIPVYTLNANAARGDVANLYRSVGRMNMRLSRIETRLEIIDEPAE